MRGLVLEVVGLFGAERCMFASNYPVDKLEGVQWVPMYESYRRCTEITIRIVSRRLSLVTAGTFSPSWTAHLSPPEQRALFHDTAARVDTAATFTIAAQRLPNRPPLLWQVYRMGFECPKCRSIEVDWLEVESERPGKLTTKKCHCTACDYRFKFQ